MVILNFMVIAENFLVPCKNTYTIRVGVTFKHFIPIDLITINCIILIAFDTFSNTVIVHLRYNSCEIGDAYHNCQFTIKGVN